MQPLRVRHRLGGDGHDQALGDGPVADVGFVEGVEEEGERVAALEDLDGTRLVLILDENGRREWYLLDLLRRGPGPLRLVHLPELRPALGSPATGRVVAAGEDGTVRKLDCKRPVFVG